MSNKLFIAVAGNIGTGKTTLTSMLGSHYNWRTFYESVEDNPYLRDFYSDMKRWSFPLQVYFLNNRFKVHHEISNGQASAIQDRSIYEDVHIFARNLYETKQLEKRDYYNYLDLYHQMTQFIRPPDLMIYLRKSVPKLVEQIKKRGRDFEESISLDYLKQLNNFYDEWIQSYRKGPVLVIDSDELDFVSRAEDFDIISHKILERLDQLELFYPSELGSSQLITGIAQDKSSSKNLALH